MIVNRIWTEVPGISRVLSELQPEHRLELGDFLMCQKLGVVHTEVWVVIGMDVCGRVLGRGVVNFKVGAANTRVGHPVIVAFVQVLKVHVVAIGILISRFGGVIIYN